MLDPFLDQPHVGKRVELWSENSQTDDILWETTTTDANGNYDFPNVPRRFLRPYWVKIQDVGGPEGYDFDHFIPYWGPRLRATEVSGIGRKLAERLAEHEITTADELAQSEPVRLSEILQVSTQRAEAFVSNARQVVEEAKAEESAALDRESDLEADSEAR